MAFDKDGGERTEGACISIAAALDEIVDMYESAKKWGEEANDDETKTRAEVCMSTLVEIRLRLDKLPAVNLAKTGHWIPGEMWSEGIGMGESYGYYFTCSECGRRIRGGYPNCGEPYCSRCGSRNEEDENG